MADVETQLRILKRDAENGNPGALSIMALLAVLADETEYAVVAAKTAATEKIADAMNLFGIPGKNI